MIAEKAIMVALDATSSSKDHADKHGLLNTIQFHARRNLPMPIVESINANTTGLVSGLC
jgi:hypothetical protein